MPAQRRIYILAGPNGAGKTTFAREFLTREAECPVFINADLIAAGLSPFAPERAAVRAGRIMLDLMKECARKGRASPSRRRSRIAASPAQSPFGVLPVTKLTCTSFRCPPRSSPSNGSPNGSARGDTPSLKK